MRALLVMIGMLIGQAASAQEAQMPCGPDAPCEVHGGSYHLMFPEDWDGVTPLPALVFFHGHNSSGKSVFRAGSLKSEFMAKGYLVIAPNGDIRPGRKTRSWPARPIADGLWRDDVAFTMSVIHDVGRYAPLAEGKLFVSGFSAGGSMAWMMACYAGDKFDGFVSVAGALRRPVPVEACPAGPVRMLQVHGFADKQVPLEGRGIGDWHQGDVFESFALMRASNQCRSNPDAITIDTAFRCREWSSCENGALSMCLHDGGHGLPKGWAGLARGFFEGAAPDTDAK